MTADNRVEVQMIQTSEAAGPDEHAGVSAAFAEVLAYGRKVARDLALTGVQEDAYKVQEALPPEHTSGYGFYGLDDEVTAPVRARYRSIGGWRVHSRLLAETLRLDLHGNQQDIAVARTVREMWLLRNGDLQEVTLTTDADGATTVSSGPLSEEVASAINDREQWRQERTHRQGTRLLRRTVILTPTVDEEFAAMEEILSQVRGRMNR